MYWISEELSTEDRDTACYVQRHRPFVEELEGEVINRDLILKILKLNMVLELLTPPMPSTASVALLMMPMVAAIDCVLV